MKNAPLEEVICFLSQLFIRIIIKSSDNDVMTVLFLICTLSWCCTPCLSQLMLMDCIITNTQ